MYYSLFVAIDNLTNSHIPTSTCCDCCVSCAVLIESMFLRVAQLKAVCVVMGMLNVLQGVSAEASYAGNGRSGYTEPSYGGESYDQFGYAEATCLLHFLTYLDCTHACVVWLVTVQCYFVTLV